ncbi:hypothetical protein ACE5SX_18115, partial [Lactiplantibacillus plantarum]|uniref:hypothetical protein n=1 Tax=Lactiplantibacillus plantarum TaxID=1590 RepID=UPI003C1E1DD1
ARRGVSRRVPCRQDRTTVSFALANFTLAPQLKSVVFTSEISLNFRSYTHNFWLALAVKN